MIIGPYIRAKIRRKTVPYKRHISSEISRDFVKTLLIFPRINGPYVRLKYALSDKIPTATGLDRSI